MNRKLRWVILASILLNVLLVGILFGQLPRRFDRDAYRQQVVDEAVKQLPESVQATFRDRMDEMRAEAEPIRNQIREARDETVRIVIGDPFDEAAFDQQVAKINELRMQMAGILKKAAKEMPPDQRRALGETLKRPSSAAR